MIPFSRYLGQWSSDEQLQAFILHWDALEALVIAVYREKMTPAAASTEFAQIWSWLRKRYPRWEPALRTLWPETIAGGQPAQSDPFHLLLELNEPADICDNWRVMQHLPAAREALNKLLLLRGET